MRPLADARAYRVRVQRLLGEKPENHEGQRAADLPRGHETDIRARIVDFKYMRSTRGGAAAGLLRTGPDGRLALTGHGQLFARDVRPALESLAQSRKSKGGNHGT